MKLLKAYNAPRQLPALRDSRYSEPIATGDSFAIRKTVFVLTVFLPYKPATDGSPQQVKTIAGKAVEVKHIALNSIGQASSAILFAKQYCSKKQYFRWLLFLGEETRKVVSSGLPDAQAYLDAIPAYPPGASAKQLAKPALYRAILPIYGQDHGRVYCQDADTLASWTRELNRETEHSHEPVSYRKANSDSAILGKNYTVTQRNAPNVATKRKEPASGISLNFATSDKIRARQHASRRDRVPEFNQFIPNPNDPHFW